MDRIKLLVTEPGYGEVEMTRAQYDAYKEAILSVLPITGEGVPFKSLAILVRDCLPEDKLNKLGSIVWHVKTIVRDMEKRNLIRMIRNGKDIFLLGR